jgi:hypothetical protein
MTLQLGLAACGGPPENLSRTRCSVVEATRGA